MRLARLPRFKRSPEVAPIRLTKRDREIFKYIHRHRFLRSDHLTSLLPGSRQQTLRRLQLLYHHGFLERPRCQIDYYHRSGSRPISYGLGNKGAGWLKRELSLPFHRLDWPSKNRVERYFLEHALLVSDFMVAIELACRQRTDIRLLSDDDINLSDESSAGRNPFRWRVNIPGGPACTVIPDRVFGLEQNGKRFWYCLEADRATMPVIRSDLDRSSFRRKLLAYHATWAQDLQRLKFGWQRFRVLTVTTDSARIATMQEACRSLPRGQGLFLFVEAKSLQEKADLLALRWQTCRQGELRGLLD